MKDLYLNFLSFLLHIGIRNSLSSIPPRMSGSKTTFWKFHICQCLSRLIALRRHRLVTVASGRLHTAEEFAEGVFSLATGLSRLGIRPGDVIAICAFNSDLYLEWLLAVTYVGGIVAPLNYRWSFEESRFALELVQPVMLVTDNSFQWSSGFFKDAVSSCKWHVIVGSSGSVSDTLQNVLTPEIIKRHSTKSASFGYLWAPEDVAIICFTSGTTGRPKGGTITHTTLIVQSLAKIAIVGYNEDDVYLHTAPLCHIGGISSALAMFMAGGCHVLIPKFEANLAVEAMEQHSVTSFITVPAIMADLVSVIRLKKEWTGSKTVKRILNGGGSLSNELLKDAIEIFPNAKIFSAYGMTETCSSMTFMSLTDPTSSQFDHPTEGLTPEMHREGGICVGKPAPHVEMTISSPDSSGVGRICTRGPHVMSQYWGQATSSSTSSSDLEDWLDTGDIGKIDHHGNVWLMGRYKDRIKSGGENIYPEEIEAVLSQHPGITAVIVVGLPHPRLTEVAVAYLNVKKGWHWMDSSDTMECKEQYLSSEMLKQYCRKKSLSGYKIPKAFVVMRKPFPRTSTGKLRREEVRREAVLYLQMSPSNL